MPETREQALDGPPDEQHERRNFLTWAFFLAQVSAAELLLTGPTKAAPGDESPQGPMGHSDPPSVQPSNTLPPITLDVAAEAQIVTPPSSSAIAQNVAPDVDTLSVTHSLPLSAMPGQTPLAAATTGSGPAALIVGSSGNANSALPDLLPDIDGTDPLTPPPPITVDIGLSPLPDFDVTIDVGRLISVDIGLDLNDLLAGPLQDITDLLVDPLQDLTGLLVDPLQDVTGLVNSLTSDLENLLNGDVLGLGDLLQSSSSNLGDLTGLTLTDGLAGLLGQGGGQSGGQSGDGASALLPSILDAANPEPVLAAITGANDFSVLDLLGGGGIIDILGGAANEPAQGDDLYALGRYTDYNIALQDNVGPAPGDAEPANATATDTPPTPDDQPPADTVIADLLPFDDLLTRPAM